MKIEVEKQDLLDALSVVGITVGSGGSDLSSHYVFRVRRGGTEVLSYDMRGFACAPLTCASDGDDGDAFTVEAWRLDKWVSGVGSGTLTLSSEGGGDVHASGPRSKVRFRSLDPSKFPYWDGLLANAEDVGSISPGSFGRALNLARWFVSGDDTSKPELCQIEAVDGVLWATDRRALSSVEIPTLPSLNVRIPGKDVGSVISFLTNSGTQGNDIIIREASRPLEDGGGSCAIFTRPDGCYVGVTRPTSQFPKLDVDREADDDATLTLDKDELNAGLAVLLASAPKGHESVSFGCEEGKVYISMPCEAGGSDEYPLSLASLSGSLDQDFTIDFPYLQGISDTFGLSKIDLGINKRGRGGFVSFRSADEGENGNKYYTVIVWRT